MTRSYYAAQDKAEDWSDIHAAEIKMGHWPITLTQPKIECHDNQSFLCRSWLLFDNDRHDTESCTEG